MDVYVCAGPPHLDAGTRFWGAVMTDTPNLLFQ
jgi:hypothetical protein